MTPKSKPKANLSSAAWTELKRLPSNVRRQMTTAIDGLEQDPRPPNSKRLTQTDEQYEARRLRLGHWRIIYLIIEEQCLVLAIRRRPPYDYSDLEALIRGVHR
ncbi:MAG: type II toxin-antitoxin system RelE/ParE family toxin [Thermoflexales bacterium]|nr:type II toxin-antitoxin system RelE/ParE family toxin [Thermoflexales bacterium]